MLVDDHLVIRQGLRTMFADVDDVVIIGEAGNAADALIKTEALRPDILLLDIRMPGVNGLRLLHRLHDRLPDVKVIVLTNYDDEQFLLEAFRAGAYGYLLKNVGRDELLDAVRTAHQGKRMLSRELINGVLGNVSSILGQLWREISVEQLCPFWLFHCLPYCGKLLGSVKGSLRFASGNP